MWMSLPCGLRSRSAGRMEIFQWLLVLLVGVKVVAAQRKELLEMRSKYEIGDDVFHQVEAQLDVAEVNAQGAEYP
jgi:hypothetical protein